LKTREGDQVIDYRNWSVPLGRRFRALKLWFVLRSYGVTEIRRRIAEHIELAREAAAWMQAAADFELLAPLSLALFNFRYHPKGLDDPDALDRLNENLLHELNNSGALYLTQNSVNGAYSIRFAVGQTSTERRHVAAAWQTIQDTARSLAS
jgi:aromatic-L-amino-acid decarboxylase